MSVLIKQALIVSDGSPLNGLTKDILVRDGIIQTIADAITENATTVVEIPGLHVSIGWIDCFAHFADPGFEYRETIKTGARSAAAGGFTDVMLLPNTQPVVDNKSQVEYIVQKGAAAIVNLLPIGAVTKNAAGGELAEMYDMANSGAVAFSDGQNALQHGGLLLKALQYLKSIDGTLIQIPEDKSIGSGGLMNEGIASTQLGLPGKPAVAEALIVNRDIQLNHYAGSRIHFTGISSASSMALIAQAKKEGKAVSCSVTPYHLYFCEDDLRTYDTNLKVNPPIRTKSDRTALVNALLDGTVDCIASHHIPQNYDAKVCEFEYAKNGMIGLETLFGVLWSIVSDEDTNQDSWRIEQLVHLLTVAPRHLFQLPLPEIKEGAKASITLFDPTQQYVFERSHIQSKSANSAFVGKTLKGKVIGIINGTKSYFN